MKPAKFLVLILLGLLSGCATTAQIVGGTQQSIAQAQAEPYNGPKARVAVVDFQNQAALPGPWWNPTMGADLAALLTSGLAESGRFILLERQVLGQAMAEQDLTKSGRIRQEAGVPTGEVEGADLLIVGRLTSVNPGTAGLGGGLGTVGSFFGLPGMIIGAAAGGIRQSSLTLDLRVVDARTSRVLATTTVEGKSTDFGGGVLGGGIPFIGALGGWQKTPLEKPLRAAVQKAVEFVVQKTPPQYYRYKE